MKIAIIQEWLVTVGGSDKPKIRNYHPIHD